MNRQRLLERFLRYVQVDTTANEQQDIYPSSPGQWELGKMLVEELHRMGYANAHQDDHALVWVTLAANQAEPAPTIAFNAHLDTSPETTGKGVKPQVIESYAGETIQLAGDSTKSIHLGTNPELRELMGATLITTDGTTLLGGDDKAGVAIMMELAETLAEQPEILHGEVKLLFTCDEEIGRGVDHVDFEKLGATACYTLDGGGANDVDIETFSADLAIISVQGINIHPAIAKDRLVNAIRIAADYVERLPRELSPEQTEGRDGFVHPYSIEGGVAKCTVRMILRDFETDRLTEYAQLLEQTAADVQADWPGSQIVVEIRKQYRNLAEGLRQEPRAAGYAFLAHERLGRIAKESIVRGGTDGSQMTERGLPTPNLSCGQHNLHSPLEWACLDEMIQAGEIAIELIKIWGEQPPLA
jgi:tripeptide aminopeptidase